MYIVALLIRDNCLYVAKELQMCQFECPGDGRGGGTCPLDDDASVGAFLVANRIAL